ncbi:hypothetical protein OIT41_08665 [Arthrobacter sp. YA7-1]|uniref:hypothetical protein n=1 Tax=Arthrobacter sp. YA7-1 TaxID=2987701 RepID=UPI00222803B6|nr:hypothetical protein [Arthrobacter sp. YA7-1]UYY83086.1 hypothetical protein OIT41_08665 [Arthrobacter sp. YA7-1]
MEAAQPDKWIDWLTDRSMIDGVWEQSMRPDSEESEVWARWICELLTSDPSGLLRLIHKHGGTLSNALWQAVWLAFWNNYPEPVVASHYLTLLMDHPASGRYLGHMSKLFSKVSTKDRAGALRLLSWLLRPNPKFVPDLVALLSEGDGELVLDFEVSADTYDLRSGWSELQPLSRAERSSLLVQCIAYVEQVSFALRNSQPRNRRDDRASLSRTKINYDEVDSHKIGIGILVDICRDVLRASCAEGSRSAHSVLEILLDSESTLCRRLALDAISETEILSSDSALEILVLKGWLYDNRLKPEMVRVLAAKYPHASPSSKSEIVNAVMGSGASGRKQHLEDYTRHSLLLQLTGSDPSDDFAAAGLTKIRLRNPGFPAEKPKSPAWNPFTGLQVYGYEPSGLLKGASTDTIVNEASNLDENEPNEEWLSELRLVVGESQSLAYSLISAFVRRKVWNLRLWEELLDGLADHGVSDASPVLQSLRSHPHKELLVPTLVSFLQSSWQRSSAKVIPASVIEYELRSVFALWRDVTGQSPWIPELETEDSTFRSMQDPRGGLVFLYLFRLRSLVSHGYRQLDEVVTSELRAFLDDGAQSLDATLVQVGAFAAFLSHVEHGWTRANVLPFLDWNRYPNQAVLMWSGFLSQDSWTKEMEPYLSRVVRVAAPWVRKHLASYFDLFLRHHARLFSFGSSRLIPVKWADPLIVNLSPLERAKWIDLISACGRSEPGLDAPTRRRMAGFWRRRAKGLPVPMSGVESAAMSAWLLISRDSFAEFCPLFLLSPVPDGSQATPRALIEMQSLPFEHEPSKSARVLIHLLKGERLFKSERHTNWLMEPARKLAKPLLSSPHEQEARGILRELIRLGDRESLQLVIGTV